MRNIPNSSKNVRRELQKYQETLTGLIMSAIVIDGNQMRFELRAVDGRVIPCVTHPYFDGPHPSLNQNVTALGKLKMDASFEKSAVFVFVQLELLGWQSPGGAPIP